MPCRCQERREAIRTAMKEKTIKQTGQTVKFVAKTMAEDALKAVNIRRKPR